MAYKEISFNVKSICPMIVHNGQLVNPRNPFSVEMKKLTGNRNKTEADLNAIARLEFLGGLYMGEDGPVIPTDVVEATLISAAKKRRDGLKAKAGLICPKHVKLEYEGPRDGEGLWENKDFVLEKPVKIGTAKIIRTRPIFNEWSATIELLFEDSIINESDLVSWMDDAGFLVGFCDWRPRYGRFTVTGHSNGHK